jgi:hypothetical protein
MEYVNLNEELLVGLPIKVYVINDLNQDDVSSAEKEAVWTERYHHQVFNIREEICGYALTRLIDNEIVVCKISSSTEFKVLDELIIECFKQEKPSLVRREQIDIRILFVTETQNYFLWIIDHERQGKVHPINS